MMIYIKENPKTHDKSSRIARVLKAKHNFVLLWFHRLDNVVNLVLKIQGDYH